MPYHFESIGHFGENQQRLERIERFAFVERVVKTVGAAAVNVGDKLAGAPLGHDAVGQIVAAAGHRDDVDAGIIALEILQQALVAVNIDGDLAFFLGRGERLLPVLFPVGLGRLRMRR